MIINSARCVLESLLTGDAAILDCFLWSCQQNISRNSSPELYTDWDLDPVRWI